jgi:4-diphosphocytidyl-2C-methyl-D-erythritol kinase
VAVSTPAVFARYAAGVRPDGGAALASSTHLAAELQSGLSRAIFLERAGVMAMANDLLPAAADLVPGLTAARRALARLLERPVGQSGSGPTLWALSPSRADAAGDAAIVRAALADGLIAFPGSRPPFVAAAALAGGQPGVPS